MKNLNDTIAHTQPFSNSTMWPKNVVSFTKAGFVFINIVSFGNNTTVGIFWQHDIISSGRDINFVEELLVFLLSKDFNWVSVLLCMGASLQRLDSSILTEQSFELNVWYTGS